MYEANVKCYLRPGAWNQVTELKTCNENHILKDDTDEVHERIDIKTKSDVTDEKNSQSGMPYR